MINHQRESKFLSWTLDFAKFLLRNAYFFSHFAEHSRKRRSQKVCKRITIRINAVNSVRISLGHLVSRSPYRQHYFSNAVASQFSLFPAYHPLYRSLLKVSHWPTQSFFQSVSISHHNQAKRNLYFYFVITIYPLVWSFNFNLVLYILIVHLFDSCTFPSSASHEKGRRKGCLRSLWSVFHLSIPNIPWKRGERRLFKISLISVFP